MKKWRFEMLTPAYFWHSLVDSKEAKNVPAELKKLIRAEISISASKGESASRGYCLSGA